MSPILRPSAAALAIATTLALAATGCSMNPATGKRELNLVSEGQEIAIGRESHPQVLAQYGVYPDDQLQAYIQQLGTSLARSSERAGLPWTFTLLDDPLVNAFALPGGFIYITRGIMTHLNSEAELAGVLGHEIGHVTARHGASQMSKALLAQIGLGIGAVAAPEVAQAYGGIAQGLAGLLFLKYGRDDERQADELGLRYSLRGSYDPQGLLDVFDTLGRVTEAAGGARGPAWASTHPAPENRSQLIREQIASAQPLPSPLRSERDAYLRRLDGMIFGANPREGFFDDSRFSHPDLAFQIDLPRDWENQNARQYVGAMNKDGNAMVQLTLVEGSSADAAKRKFFEQQGLREGQSWAREISDLPATSRSFGVEAEQGGIQIEGWGAWVEYGGRVYQLLGYAKAENASQAASVLRSSIASFRRLEDPTVLNIEPMRVRLVEVKNGQRPRDLPALRSAISDEQLALINRVSLSQPVAAKIWLKSVHGFNPVKVPNRPGG